MILNYFCLQKGFKMNKLLTSYIVLLFLMSCASSDKVIIKSNEILDKIPSASGSEYIDGINYIVGDDSPWLFLVDKNNFILDKKLLVDSSFVKYYKIPKKIKPDFESVFLIKDKLYILGSGSSKLRNVLKVYDVKDQSIKQYSLGKLYDHLNLLDSVGNKKFNIEGIAVTNEHVYLTNRGNNALYETEISEFENYILTDKLPEFKIRYFELPPILGNESAFSGLDFDEDDNSLIFTSSVEQNNAIDPINDGEILGSFMGKIYLDDLDKLKFKAFPFKEANGDYMKIKAESVSVLGNRVYQIVTDSDGEGSKVLKIKLK